MKLNDLKLRCYAEIDDGSWFAICLPLNLYARGDSFEEARAKLQGLISQYVREAVTVHAEHIGDLIPRRAPLYFWVRYAIARCWHMFHDAHAAMKRREFDMPLTMVPA